MAFRWRDSLATGIEKVDDQHKELIKRTNDLLEHMKKGEGNNEVMKTLDFLSSYVVEHFHDEEEVMKMYNYPLFVHHKQLHDNFVKVVKELGNQVVIEKNLITLIIKVNKEVCDWLIDHILKEDREMAQYVKSHQ